MSEYSDLILSRNPVAYWRLGEASGTTLYDATPNGYDLTTFNSPTLGTTGLLVDESDTAVTFDGVNQRATSNSVEFSLSPNNEITMECWFKPNRGGGVGASGACGPVYLGGVAFIWDHAAPSFQNTFAANIAGTWRTVALPAFTPGEVYHLVGTISTTEMKVYVDGQLVATGAFAGGTAATTQTASIGGHPTVETSFQSVIDEVAVYPRALTPEEVAENYAAAKYSGYAQKIIEDRPVAYWRLGDVSGTTAKDETGNYDLTYVGGPTLGATGSLVGDSNTAVTFDGTMQYATRTEAGFRGSDTQGSVEFWVYQSQFDAGSVLSTSKANDSDPYLIFRLLSDGLISISYSRSTASTWGGYQSSSAIQLDSWNHVVFVGTGSAFKGFINGQEVAFSHFGGTDNYVWFSHLLAATKIYIGAYELNNSIVNYFDGTIDEVAVYDYPLTPQQIAKHYAWGMMTGYERAVRASAPVAYWRLGESSGTTAVDEMGNYDMTYVGPPTLGAASLVPVESDKAVTFSGVDQYASIQNAAFGISTYTFEAWIKITNLPGSGDKDLISGVAESYNSSTADKLLRVDENGTLHAYVYDGAAKNVSSSVNLSAGTTYHVVMVAGTSTLKIYINGVERGSVAATGSYSGFSTPTLLLAGKTVGTSTSSLHFDGTIDEVAVYDYALSAEEIYDHYKTGITIYEIPGINITLHDGSTPLTSLTGLTILWWDSAAPTGAPAYEATDETTDASGVLSTDLTGITGLPVGSDGFLLIYKEDGTDHTDSQVFASKWTVQDIS